MNRRLRLLQVLVLVTTALLSTVARSSSWHFAWVGNDSARYFFDAESIEKSKEVVTIWIKTVRTTDADKDGSWATAFRWRLNCQRKTIQSLAWSSYDQSGKFIRSNSAAGSEDAVVPDSTGEAMLKIACKPNFPKDSSGDDYFKLDNNDVFQATKNYMEYKKSQVDSAPK